MRILVVGASGYLGGHLARAFARDPRHRVRTFSRTPLSREDHYQGSLTDPAAVERAVAGVDVIVHAAHARPDSPDPLPVSHEGTMTLCAAAHRLGVPRIVLMSTTAVYGHGAHSNLEEGQARRVPGSALSRARAVAEDIVLDHGGLALRTPLVLGEGDQWVIPGVFAALDRVGGWVDRGQALQSVLQVSDLAVLVDDLLHTQTKGAMHLAHPQPLSVRSIAQAVAGPLGLHLDDTSVSLERASALLPTRHLDMLAYEHTYATTRLQQAVSSQLGSPLSLSDADVLWYRRLLRRG